MRPVRSVVAISAAVGLVLPVVAAGRARAADGYAVSAPYTAAGHSASTTCAWPDVAPHCATTARADAGSGTMGASAATDSGAGGTLPGTAESDAVSLIEEDVHLGRAPAATVVVHVHVAGVSASSTGLGRSYVYVSAGSPCGQCADSEPYQFIDAAGDVALRLPVHRPGAGADQVPLRAEIHVITYVACDDLFCVAPTGSASGSVSATVTRIDVRRG